MPLFHYKALTALLLVASAFPCVRSELIQDACPPQEAHGRQLRRLSSTTIIENGVIMLGINDEGQLNVPNEGIIDGHTSASVGLKYFRDGSWFDSTSYGCECEGFGVSAKKVSDGTSFWGGANDSSGGVTYLSASPIVSDGLTATTVANVTSGPLSVTHDFRPSPATSNLYEVEVSMENTSPTETLTELRYRRTMDWDIPPSPFNECVSIIYGTQPKDLEYATDDGFEQQNPLTDTSNSGISFSCPTGGSPCPVYDDGPNDHGVNFQFLFKEDDGVTNASIGPGESMVFKIFYGAAANKSAANAALGAVGAEVASFGYPPVSVGCNAENDGSPGVYIFAFGDVGGEAVVLHPPPPPPLVSSSPISVPTASPPSTSKSHKKKTKTSTKSKSGKSGSKYKKKSGSKSGKSGSIYKKKSGSKS